ncbi:hypothetical protein Hanom_Chr02g00136111 [Helianthus anomalus]
MMAKATEVENQTKSTESSNQVRSMGKDGEDGKKFENKTEVQCRKCMEPSGACTEKAETLKSRNIEFTKFDDLLKERVKKIDLLKKDLVLKENQIRDLNKKMDILESNLKESKSASEKQDFEMQKLKEHNNMLSIDYNK